MYKEEIRKIKQICFDITEESKLKKRAKRK